MSYDIYKSPKKNGSGMQYLYGKTTDELCIEHLTTKIVEGLDFNQALLVIKELEMKESECINERTSRIIFFNEINKLQTKLYNKKKIIKKLKAGAK